MQRNLEISDLAGLDLDVQVSIHSICPSERMAIYQVGISWVLYIKFALFRQ